MQYNIICTLLILIEKRSFIEVAMDSQITTIEQLGDSIPVQQFNLDGYLAQIAETHRARRSSPCAEQKRFILFIMDTSGSIGCNGFDAAKNAIANVAELLCDYIKVAMITYDTSINLEFCFNCYENDRSAIKEAILRARYRGGETHTTDAIKCACDEMLTSRCGLPQGINTPNIDVILLTDGKHNGPCRSRLDAELQCLNQTNINTIGIGIGEADNPSVVKLTRGNAGHIFRVGNTTELQQLVTITKELLKRPGEDGKPRTCAGHLNSLKCHG